MSAWQLQQRDGLVDKPGSSPTHPPRIDIPPAFDLACDGNPQMMQGRGLLGLNCSHNWVMVMVALFPPLGGTESGIVLTS